jgi:triosephosphate isomerase
VILGHSERRAYFGETYENINRKVGAALKHGLTPILCVGEKLEEREAGRAVEVISGQVQGGLQGNAIFSGEQLVVAYEPVWAIGTGRSATAEDADQVIGAAIRITLARLFGEDTAAAVRVLYGGSVTEDNAGVFFRQPEIDGALVGGASLRADSFVGIVNAARV